MSRSCGNKWGTMIAQRPYISPEVLSHLHATTTDSSKWQVFCNELSKVADTPIMMFGHNLGTNEGLGLIAGGLDPVELDRYQLHFADKNPWMHMNAIMPVGAVGISDQALRREDLFKTEFYNDWLKQQEDVVAGPFMMCHRTNDTFVGMAAACRAHSVDKTLSINFDLFKALAPHISRSISMSSVLVNGGPASFKHFQASGHGIIVICRSGQVGMVNPAAETFMAQSQSISVDRREHLAGKDETIQAFLSAAHLAMVKNAFDELPKPLRVGAPELGPCILHAHIFPSNIDCEFPASAWLDPAVGVLVIAGAAGLQQECEYGQLAQLLGATPAEARLAEAIMAGQSAYDFADANKLSRHTVRNQMNALLHKLDVSSQSGLVRKLYQLSSPFKA